MMLHFQSGVVLVVKLALVSSASYNVQIAVVAAAAAAPVGGVVASFAVGAARRDQVKTGRSMY